MKKFIGIIALCLAIFLLAGCTKAKQQETTNTKVATYKAEAKGFGGTITAEVTIDGNVIKAVKLTGPNETPTVGGVAVKQLGDRIVAANSLNIDLISGATVSSTAIITAVRDCLNQAGLKESDLAVVETGAVGEKKPETLDVDVVVVGAGGAGMTAAITLKQAGANVVVLEKMPYVGGNTSKASGGMNAAETKTQKESAAAATNPKVKAAIEDSTVKNFIADTMEGGHQINNIDLVTTLAENSASGIEWLDSIGAPLPALAATGGTVHYYLHEPQDGSAVGDYLVQKYSAKLDEMGIKLMLNTKADSLIIKDGKVTGVMAEDEGHTYTINAKAVILATGGFGANFDMLAKYDPSLAHAVTTNSPSSTGDGIVMAQNVGADIVDMEQIQLHPTVYQENGFLVSERLRSNGAILVNAEGKRFINDLAARDTVSQAELKQPGCYAYIVYDSKYANQKLYQKYVTTGLTKTSDTLEGLAKEMGLDATATANFLETVKKWNAVCKGQNVDEFGRKTGLETLEDGPFFAIKIAPGIHHTMGGLKINTNAEVLNTEGNVIKGLYAAGEVTGGVHGGNRIGGNAVADVVVFGRIAAQSALNYIGK